MFAHAQSGNGSYHTAKSFTTSSIQKFNTVTEQNIFLFMENRGQILNEHKDKTGEILFSAKSRGVQLYFTSNSIHYQFAKAVYSTSHESLNEIQAKNEMDLSPPASQVQYSTHRFTVELVGSNPSPLVRKEGESNYMENFYLPHCPDGILGVKGFGKIIYEDVYPGIDWVLYSNDGFMKYDFVVHAGADRSLIKMNIKDADSVFLNINGELLMRTRLGEVKEEAPVTFGAKQKKLASRFVVLPEGTISFEIDAPKNVPMRIDPGIMWSTYYGGSGDESGLGCATDASGNLFLAGTTKSVSSIASGGYQNSYSAGFDAFLVKMNSAGTRLWATYYGQSGDDQANSCATDAVGNIYLAGHTWSSTGIASGGSHQSLHGGLTDAFLVKFNSSGARLWSTYYGGSGTEYGNSCAVDASGFVYLSGSTNSDAGIANAGMQLSRGGDFDAFLVKFNSSGARIWGTYYGGAGRDDGFSCAVLGSTNVYLTGSTASSNGIATVGAYQTEPGGGRDAFVVKFNAAGSRQWGTYYGGTGTEYDNSGSPELGGRSCAVDQMGNIFLSGNTNSTGISFNGFQNLPGGNYDAFLVKFNSEGYRIWATYYGGVNKEDRFSCATDANGNIFLTGATSSSGLACSGFQNTSGGFSDALIVKFNAGGLRLWASYYGGNSNDYAHSCTVDGSNNLYIAGETSSATGIAFLAFQNTLGGSRDALLAKIDQANATGINITPASGIVYVNIAAAAGGDGSSWGNAVKELADALLAAKQNSDIQQIWVAKGVYKPLYSADATTFCSSGSTNRTNAFVLVNNVKLYGGFSGSGTETMIAQRNIAANPTILSGDIGTIGVSADNAYHVVVSAGAVGTAMLDGFTIAKGNANNMGEVMVNGVSSLNYRGGGITIILSSPVINNCIITDNFGQNGGGFSILSSSPALNHCTISNNLTATFGGAIDHYVSNATLSNAVLNNCLVSGNRSLLRGGAFVNTPPSVLTLNNSTVSGNFAQVAGGAIFDPINHSGEYEIINNSIVWGNDAGTGKNVFIGSSTGKCSANNSLFENAETFLGNGNIVSDPLFINPVSASLAPTPDGNYRLEDCSPAINTGALSTLPPAITLDMDGNSRVIADSVDIGVYETASPLTVFTGGAMPDVNGRIYVDSATAVPGNGSSWSNALREVADALIAAKYNSTITEIWVARGTYKPRYNTKIIYSGCEDLSDRTNAFILVDGISLFGGFSGSGVETSVGQRNWMLNRTILSGDIGIAGLPSDNSHHVVISAGPGSQLLDGFIIKDGNANGATSIQVNGFSIDPKQGAGMIINHGTPTIVNCSFEKNLAEFGGALSLENGSNVNIKNSGFKGNTTTSHGSAICNHESLLTATNCLMSGNKSGNNCIHVRGASTSQFVNCTLAGNNVGAGAVIYSEGAALASIRNSIIYNNSTETLTGSGFSIISSVRGNTPLGNPSFVFPVNAAAAPTLNGDYRLLKCSPAINAGIDALVPAGVLTELDNQSRFYGTVDLGAYEYSGSNVLAIPNGSGVVFVNQEIASEGDGSSWASAIKELADALRAAKTNSSITQIWVAKGVYKPKYNSNENASCAETVNRNNTFELVSGVKVYGGFSGNGSETSITQRNWRTNITVLSGDIGSINIASDNSYHVVTSAGPVGTAQLNGFTISHGRADASGSVVINGQTISKDDGGGLYVVNSSPGIENCIIKDNFAANDGGGIYAEGVSSVFVACSVSGNSALNGGGIYLNQSGVSIVNCALYGNLATGLGGALYNYAISSVTTIRNCVIAANRSLTNGGGLYFTGSLLPIAPPSLIYNSIIFGNKLGAGVSNFSTVITSAPEVRRSIIENAGGYTNSGTNLIGAANDPQFISPGNASEAPTSQGNYSVSKCSPAINSGDNSYIAGFAVDIAGNARIINTTVDRGAYENDNSNSATPNASGVVFVSRAGSGIGNSWDNAVPELSHALFAARTNAAITEIWVAGGTYLPQYDISFNCSPTDQRDKTFVLVNNVKLYGGFKGDETSVADRNWALYKTILSGDIGIQGSTADNSYHVMVSAGGVGVAEVDGFTISDGEATGSGTVNVNGITFARGSCGGMYIINSSPAITNCIIKNNRSSGVAGGAYVSNSNSVFTNCIISGNACMSGSSQGGGIYNNNSGSSFMTFRNCTVTGNRAAITGGVRTGTLGSGRAKIYNSIIYGNETNAGVTNSDLESSSSTTDDPDVYYSIIGNAGGSGIYNNLAGNSNADPLFVDPLDASLAPTPGGNYRIRKCAPSVSPALNSGSNTYVLASNVKDLDGNFRTSYTTVDKGAYEKVLAVPSPSGVVFVNKTNTAGEGDGSSWNNAVVELSDALKMAKFNTSIKEIWVAAGTYKPSYLATLSANDIACPVVHRDNSFVVVNDVKLYGGFSGNEIFLSERDVEINETILSGDIDNTPANFSGNAHHVVISAGNVNEARLDGFTIVSGNANQINSVSVNGQNVFRGYGAGIHLVSSSPQISNCIFESNWATDGAGMYSNGGAPGILNCTFRENIAVNNAGAICNVNSDPAIFNCRFESNTATSGGALYNNAGSDPVIKNCVFAGNSGSSGGAISNNSASNAVLMNCVLSGNSASANGGAIISASSSNIIITNSTIAGNSASVGGALYNISSDPVIQNSILYGNSNVPVFNSGSTPVISYSIIQGGHSGEGNVDADPEFLSSPSFNTAPFISGDYRLSDCSPALNTGFNNYTSDLETDLAFSPRIAYDDVDLGAYEMQGNTYKDGNITSWKGVNTNWNDKVNWCGGYIPLSSTDVTIPDQPNDPVVKSGFSNEVNNITLSNNTSFTIESSGTFSINGLYANSGSSIINNGHLQFAGSTAGTIFPGLNGTVSAMMELEINNSTGILFNKSFDISGRLIPTKGNINISDGTTITLKSNAERTASMDVVQPGASISYSGSGAFTVERYINTGTDLGQHGKSWQFLATPTGGQTFYQSWQENGIAASAHGTIITGTGTGFDISTQFPSLKYYDESTGGWAGVTNTHTPMQNSLGYMVFVRGDRTVTTYNADANPTDLRSRGHLHSPTNPPPSVTVPANRFQSVGNPYASRIEFSKVLDVSSGINDVIYVWDPTLNGNYNLGGYQILSGITGYRPNAGVLGSFYEPASSYPYIESGQAFFVRGEPTGGTVNFEEEVKVSGSRLVNRRPLVLPRTLLITNLLTASGSMADGAINVFGDSLDNDLNEHDAIKLTNPGENFGMWIGDSIIGVQARNSITDDDTIFFYQRNLSHAEYELQFIVKEMPQNMQGFLIDRFLNSRTEVSLSAETRYKFTVNAETGSSDSRRFLLVFKQMTVVATPILQIASVQRQGETVVVSYNIENGDELSECWLERSSDGRMFETIRQLRPQQVATLRSYSYSDQEVLNECAYYRIKASRNTGQQIYSNVAVTCKKMNADLFVYPNPTNGIEVNLRWENAQTGSHTAQVLNVLGQVLHFSKLDINSNSGEAKIQFHSPLGAGVYFLIIRNVTENIIRSFKFVVK